jgi:hypothetical protein
MNPRQGHAADPIAAGSVRSSRIRSLPAASSRIRSSRIQQPDSLQLCP